MRRTVEMPAGDQPFHAGKAHAASLSPLEQLAVRITERIGSMGFFFIILTWTILWCGYNILASSVPSLGWKAFDPFPAFVAYLLISNVIQILLMPLIMVGQNVQGRQSELRAENDYRVNIKAEKEVLAVLARLDSQQQMMITMMQQMGVEQHRIEECMANHRHALNDGHKDGHPKPHAEVQNPTE